MLHTVLLRQCHCNVVNFLPIPSTDMRTWEKIGHVIVTLHCVCLTLHFPRGRLIFIYPGLFPLPWWVNMSLSWILHHTSEKLYSDIIFDRNLLASWVWGLGVIARCADQHCAQQVISSALPNCCCTDSPATACWGEMSFHCQGHHCAGGHEHSEEFLHQYVACHQPCHAQSYPSFWYHRYQVIISHGISLAICA